MPILGLFSIIFQVLFGIHAVKTGRERWLWIIIFFPGAGCLIYFLVEYLPDLQHTPGAQKARKGLMNAVDPGREVRSLQDELERTDSVKNRKSLAEAYINAGRFNEAISLLKSCQSGVNNDDPTIIEGLSLAYFFQQNYEEAQKKLIKLKEIQGDKQSNEFKILMARTYEELGDNQKALEQYGQLVKLFSGEEARCRYGLLLKKMGRQKEARDVFNEIIKEARVAPKFFRRTQKQWIDIAKKEV